jgi:CBS domain containing-hemolysin-like protein
MMELFIFAFLVLVSLGFSAFFSGSETAAISANRFKLKSLELNGNQRAEEVLGLLRNMQRVIAITLVGTNVSNVLCALFGREFFRLAIPEELHVMVFGYIDFDHIVDLLVLTPIILIFGEILPKQFFRANADSLMMKLHFPIRFFSFLFVPVVRLLNGVAYFMLSPMGIKAGHRVARITKDELQSLVSEGMISRADETSERHMISRIFRLEKTLVREVMRPLVDVVAVRLDYLSIDGFIDLVRRTGYSRLPVFKDRIVNMIGYVDVYRVLATDWQGKRLDNYIEEAYYVPETKRVDDLLHEFLLRKLRVAIVIDEFGGCSGWVTLEDLLEEIVGEIRDEYDRDKEAVVEQEPGTYLVDAKMDIDDFNQQLGLRVRKRDFETVGGYVYYKLGRVPKAGDKVYEESFVLQVKSMDRHKISTLLLTKVSDKKRKVSTKETRKE